MEVSFLMVSVSKIAALISCDYCIFVWFCLVASQCAQMKHVQCRPGREGAQYGVATKLAVQMNTKLGGVPWKVDIPMKVSYDRRKLVHNYSVMLFNDLVPSCVSGSHDDWI